MSFTVLVGGEAEGRGEIIRSSSEAFSASERGSEQEDKAHLLGYFLMVP